MLSQSRVGFKGMIFFFSFFLNEAKELRCFRVLVCSPTLDEYKSKGFIRSASISQSRFVV